MTIKASRPETQGEAEAFHFTANHYRHLGLCHTCAAQAAYGHQLGFSLIDSPCRVCATVVACMPKTEVNGWRSKSPSTSAQWRTAVAA